MGVVSGNGQSGQSGTWAGYGERAKTARAIGDPPAQSAVASPPASWDGPDGVIARAQAQAREDDIQRRQAVERAKYEAALAERQRIADFAPTQPELRQLLIAKLRALATDLDTSTLGKKYPNSGEVQQRVARLGDIARALE